MNIEGIKNEAKPSKALQAMIEEHCGPNGKFHAGGAYVNVPEKLAQALIKEKFAKPA